MEFEIKDFNSLTNRELFEIYSLRCKVFVVEQNCAYQDVDEKDLDAFHVLGKIENKIVAYSRIIPPTSQDFNPHIGRVVVQPLERASGKGYELMKYSIHQCLELTKNQDIIISAQVYLKNFYNNLGFIAEGSEYLEDDIPHVRMRYSFVEKSK